MPIIEDARREQSDQAAQQALDTQLSEQRAIQNQKFFKDAYSALVDTEVDLAFRHLQKTIPASLSIGALNGIAPDHPLSSLSGGGFIINLTGFLNITLADLQPNSYFLNANRERHLFDGQNVFTRLSYGLEWGTSTGPRTLTHTLGEDLDGKLDGASFTYKHFEIYLVFDSQNNLTFISALGPKILPSSVWQNNKQAISDEMDRLYQNPIVGISNNLMKFHEKLPKVSRVSRGESSFPNVSRDPPGGGQPAYYETIFINGDNSSHENVEKDLISLWQLS